MNSPSPKKPAESVLANGRSDLHSHQEATDNRTKLSFEEQLLKKESQIADLDEKLREKMEKMEKLKAEAAKRKESEDQMKQVLAQYEKAISSLIAEKEEEKKKCSEEVQVRV